MNHIGTQEIRTDRLLLRKIKESDYLDMYDFTQKESVAKYVSWTPHENAEVTRGLCKMWQSEYSSPDRYNWAIVYNGKVIGNIDIVCFIGETAMLGWQIDDTYWNMGIVTEAAEAVKKYMFEKVQVKALEARYLEPNIGSGRVMQKIGMKQIPCYESEIYKIKGDKEFNGDKIIHYRLER